MTGTLLVSIYVFVLAMFVGFEVITKVPPTISIVGALVIAGSGGSQLLTIIGFIAVVLATINVIGGFMVTDRMLRMFRRDRDTEGAS
jgi:NAD(P) transhydrogenase subunit alpha